MFEIRRYQPEDHEAVWQLHVGPLQLVGAYLGDGPWDDDLRDIESAYLNNDGEFLVGVLERSVIAMGAFRKTGAARAEIKRMRVHPDYQGKGFGQMIWDDLEARAIELGYKQLHLDTSVRQTAAQGLYRKNGCREAGRALLHGLECIFFEKQIG
jgi:ribosomal protein S18 acetylase RimI-like enzyme